MFSTSSFAADPEKKAYYEEYFKITGAKQHICSFFYINLPL